MIYNDDNNNNENNNKIVLILNDYILETGKKLTELSNLFLIFFLILTCL